MSLPEDDRHQAMVHMMPDTAQTSPLAAGTSSLHSNFWLLKKKNLFIQQFLLEVGNKKALCLRLVWGGLGGSRVLFVYWGYLI